MKILIFEGIATGGKSTIITKLKNALTGKQVIVVGEPETHVPIMGKTSEKHIDFFRKLITKKISENPDILIFDRLYLTQAYRAKCELSEYSELENELKKYLQKIVDK